MYNTDIRSEMLDVILESAPELMKVQKGVEIFTCHDLPDVVLNNANNSFTTLIKKQDVMCILSTSPNLPGWKGIMFLDNALIFSTDDREYFGGYYWPFEKWKELDASQCPDTINPTVLQTLMQRLYNLIPPVQDNSVNMEFYYLGYYSHLYSLTYQIMIRMDDVRDDQLIKFSLNHLRAFVSDYVICLKYADDLEKQKEGVSIRNGNECIFEFWESVRKYGENYSARSYKSEHNRESYFRWLHFWSMLLYDPQQFKEVEKVDMLAALPDGLLKIVLISDEIAESKGMEKLEFSKKLGEFGENVFPLINHIYDISLDMNPEDSDYQREYRATMKKADKYAQELFELLKTFCALQG